MLHKIVTKSLPCLLLLLLYCACQPEDQFRLEGSIVGEQPDWLYLEYAGKLDSARVTEGKFTFQGLTERPLGAKFRTKGISAMAQDRLFLEPGVLQVQLRIEQKQKGPHHYQLLHLDSVKGTETARIRANFEAFLEEAQTKYNFKEVLFKKLLGITRQHPESDYTAYLISQHWKSFTDVQLKKLANAVAMDRLTPDLAEAIKLKLDPDRRLEVGDQLADFTLADVHGKPISTSDFRGKKLLINFWASWCGPCRKEHPEMNRQYPELLRQGYEILGVSVDTDTINWHNALDKDGLQWPNVIEPDHFGGPTAARYEVSVLPTNILVDEAGLIIAKDFHFSELLTHSQP